MFTSRGGGLGAGPAEQGGGEEGPGVRAWPQKVTHKIADSMQKNQDVYFTSKINRSKSSKSSGKGGGSRLLLVSHKREGGGLDRLVLRGPGK
jgi:hypothetical protein